MPRDLTFARGLAMRYVAYDQATGQRLGVLPDVLAGTFTCPRQATPSLTLSYPNGDLGVRGNLLDTAAEIAVELLRRADLARAVQRPVHQPVLGVEPDRRRDRAAPRGPDSHRPPP